MKVKGIEIKIVKGLRAEGTIVLDGATLSRGDIYAKEKSTRRVCGQALKNAKSAGAKKVCFFVSTPIKGGLSVVAIAKILAQEIYRVAREGKSHWKEVVINSCDERTAGTLRKTIYGYLAHLFDVLTQGPFVTVDTIIEVKGGIVLIKRKNPPFGWAIPGGFLDYGETLEVAAKREAQEETGLNVTGLKQFHTYSDPSRDPRFHTVTAVFVCKARGIPKAASDAAEARVFPLGAWRDVTLAFDHRKVLEDYLNSRR